MPRVPPHFKVRTSVKNHVKMAEVYADPWLFSLWVKLGIEAIERFADRTGDTFILHKSELLALTGKGRSDVAATLLRRLADVSPISAERHGDVYSIHIPNLAKKHGFGQKNRSHSGPHADADADAVPPNPPTRGGAGSSTRRKRRTSSSYTEPVVSKNWGDVAAGKAHQASQDGSGATK